MAESYDASPYVRKTLGEVLDDGLEVFRARVAHRMGSTAAHEQVGTIAMAESGDAGNPETPAQQTARETGADKHNSATCTATICSACNRQQAAARSTKKKG